MAPKIKVAPQKQLAAVVRSKGSGAAVAKELRCSQQSVSAWMTGVSTPRPRMQRKIQKRYGIAWTP